MVAASCSQKLIPVYRTTSKTVRSPARISCKILFHGACSPVAGYGLLMLEVFPRSHTTTHHSRQDSSGRVISPSQRPLPDNTQHSQQTSMPPAGFEPTISAGERPQTHSLDCAATGTGTNEICSLLIKIEYHVT